MKKDQANKTNVERVYRWQPLAWEPGLNGSGIDLWLVQEWVQHSCTSCASTHWSWSGAEAEWRWKRQSGGGWGQRWLEAGGEERRSWGGWGWGELEGGREGVGREEKAEDEI